jgi:hypothetical protein
MKLGYRKKDLLGSLYHPQRVLICPDGYLVGLKVRRKFEGYNRDYVGDVHKYDTATKLYLVVYDDEKELYVIVREVLKILYVPPKNMTKDSENVSEDEWDNENNINDNSRNNDSRYEKGGSNSGRDNNIRGDNDNIINDNSRSSDFCNKKGGSNSGRNDNDNKFILSYLSLREDENQQVIT